MKVVSIYTDGSCKGNPGPGGWGALLSCEGKTLEIFGSAQNTTNNRMELQAVISALKALKTRCNVRIFTDSMYVQKCVQQSLPVWVLNNFIREGQKIPNADLWCELNGLLPHHVIGWNWVKGHAGDPGNERADELANQGAMIAVEESGSQKPVAEISEDKMDKLKAFGDLLKAHCVRHEVKNNGLHYIVYVDEKRWDYWPTSQKWSRDGKFNKGLVSFMKDAGIGAVLA